MGYTGNFVCGVWFGNDDYQVTNRMTGGSLPAMTWHSIMAYAHEGIELKQLPGVPIPQVRQPQAVVAENSSKSKSAVPPPPARPALLTKKGADVLVRIERGMDDANRALGPTTSNQPPSAPLKPPSDKQVQNAPAQGPGAAAPAPISETNGRALASSLEGRSFGTGN
jgi:penicillin-binding protein 1A